MYERKSVVIRDFFLKKKKTKKISKTYIGVFTTFITLNKRKVKRKQKSNSEKV